MFSPRVWIPLSWKMQRISARVKVVLWSFFVVDKNLICCFLSTIWWPVKQIIFTRHFLRLPIFSFLDYRTRWEIHVVIFYVAHTNAVKMSSRFSMKTPIPPQDVFETKWDTINYSWNNRGTPYRWMSLCLRHKSCFWLGACQQFCNWLR